jgi:hypothetical protein
MRNPSRASLEKQLSLNAEPQLPVGAASESVWDQPLFTGVRDLGSRLVS